MKKIIIIIIMLIPINVFAININSKSAYLVNISNDEVLYEYNKDEIMPIASLTKIMTSIVSLENINSLEDKVVVDEDDLNILNDYITIGYKVGDEVSYEELLYATIMYSAADAANILCNHVFNSREVFINKMNEFASKLTMNNTVLSNPIGVDDGNYSTSYDLYLLLKYALNNKNFYDIYTKKKYDAKTLNKSINNYFLDRNDIDYKNNNFLGFKSGYTNGAGLCLSSLSNVHDNSLLLITLNAGNDQKSNYHILDHISLVNEISNNYSNRVILSNSKVVDTINYVDGNKNYDYEIKSKDDIKYFMKNTEDLNYLKVYYVGMTSINNNISDNERIGNIVVSYNDKEIYNGIVRFDYKNIIKKGDKKNYKNIFIVIVVCIIGLFIFRKRK